MTVFDDYDRDDADWETSEFQIEMEKLIQKEVTVRNEQLVTEHAFMKQNISVLKDELSELRDAKRRMDATIKAAVELAVVEAKQNTIKELTGGFTIDQDIWIARNESNRVSCNNCHGEKTFAVIVPDGSGTVSKVNCPVCKGYGALSFDGYVPHKAKIQRMSIQKECNSWRLSGSWTGDYRYNNSTCEADASYCFETLELCQVACDKLVAESKVRQELAEATIAARKKSVGAND